MSIVGIRSALSARRCSLFPRRGRCLFSKHQTSFCLVMAIANRDALGRTRLDEMARREALDQRVDAR